MKACKMCVGGLVLALLVWGCDRKQVAGPEEKESAAPLVRKLQASCPVMAGRKISKSIYVDHNGKRIYFCCQGCPKVFKKDPEKFIKKLEAEGVEIEDAPFGTAPASAPEPKITQTACPVTGGGGVDTSIYVDYKGKRIYFCCPRCPSIFRKDPEKYMKILKPQGVERKDAAAGGKSADTHKPGVVQTTCPIEGKRIDGNIYMDHKGKLVYLCSVTCMWEFQEDPEKYIRKLLAKGVELDDAPISCGGCGPLPAEDGGEDEVSTPDQ